MKYKTHDLKLSLWTTEALRRLQAAGLWLGWKEPVPASMRIAGYLAYKTFTPTNREIDAIVRDWFSEGPIILTRLGGLVEDGSEVLGPRPGLLRAFKSLRDLAIEHQDEAEFPDGDSEKKAAPVMITQVEIRRRIGKRLTVKARSNKLGTARIARRKRVMERSSRTRRSP